MGWDHPPRPCEGCAADLDDGDEVWVQTGVGITCVHAHEHCAPVVLATLKAQWGTARRVPRPLSKEERSQRKADDRAEYEELGQRAPD